MIRRRSGPIGTYIWKKPDDPGGSATTGWGSDAVGSTTGNSFIFDAPFTAGIPAFTGYRVSVPCPMFWTT